MKICRVIGKAQATVKHASMEGARLLVLRELDPAAKPTGGISLAVDTVGAGEGETVAVSMGSAAAKAFGGRETPVDAVVVAIIDTVSVDGKEIYSRKEEKK
ncbi:MAG: EutN/CcmL family microcompartment protein [Rectinemataceae bacterium]